MDWLDLSRSAAFSASFLHWNAATANKIRVPCVLASLASRSHQNALRRQSSRDSIYRSLPPKEVLSDGPHGRTSSSPLPKKLDCPPPHRLINGPECGAQKRVDRRTVGKCNLSGGAPSRMKGKPAALDGQQPRDLGRRPAVTTSKGPQAALLAPWQRSVTATSEFGVRSIRMLPNTAKLMRNRASSPNVSSIFCLLFWCCPLCPSPAPLATLQPSRPA